MGGLRRVAITALIGLVAGCMPLPAASPSAPGSTVLPTSSAAAQGSQAAPLTPAPLTGLGDTWERIELPGERPDPAAAGNGDSGLVIVGRRCIGANANRCTQTASAWHSEDNGATWQLATFGARVLHPATASHRDAAPARRRELGITDGLVRISVGIENSGDIIADIDQALSRAAK